MKWTREWMKKKLYMKRIRNNIFSIGMNSWFKRVEYCYADHFWSGRFNLDFLLLDAYNAGIICKIIFLSFRYICIYSSMRFKWRIMQTCPQHQVSDSVQCWKWTIPCHSMSENAQHPSMNMKLIWFLVFREKKNKCVLCVSVRVCVCLVHCSLFQLHHKRF